ncbi:glycoside hydrolase family 81 [Trichoderma arundinaceum]|uniref:glucan endo-1,3-beta-D-glucosidase n=1 Tax=Trichoderma arundinaceum TaxID=490622 RepID=A0A395NH94_TRIAR|nr:glycoside hydrolase family 81 [Trichoderma arundinaceum]
MVLYHAISWLCWLTIIQGTLALPGLDNGQGRFVFSGKAVNSKRPIRTRLHLPFGSFLLNETSASGSLFNSTFKTQTTSSSQNNFTTTVALTASSSPIETVELPQSRASSISEGKFNIPEDPLIVPQVSAPETADQFNTRISAEAEAAESETIMASRNIFSEPIDVRLPPPQISTRHDHPVPRKGIQENAPLQTNKFYSNFFLEDQRCPTFTFPYSVAWAGGRGVTASWGMACSHTDASQRVFGKEKFNGASSYYLNPVGIQSIVLSAKELGRETTLTIDSMTAFSARVHLSPDSDSPPAISFPLVQGMAYITAQYNGVVPIIQTGVFFKTMTRVTRNLKSHLAKFTFNLEDGSTWLVYAWRKRGDPLELRVVNNGLAEARNPFYGVIQVCKCPQNQDSEDFLDDGAGIYPVTVELTGTARGYEGSYSFHFDVDGHPTGNLYMYALPHHIDSFDRDTERRVQREAQLQSTTKGLATLVRGNRWTMVEPSMPIDMAFAPWDPEKGSVERLSHHAKSIIRAAAAREVAENMIAQSNLDSMYFSGKATLYHTGMGQLKAAFATFAANEQKFPLVHESESKAFAAAAILWIRGVMLTHMTAAAWGGIVSSASYVTGNSGADFGNTYYNDHHFHYGYHILAAAIIGHLDSDWLKHNKDYVNVLVRDVANPSEQDRLFPMWRNFDWYHGHSWAHGLYAAMDGKDQESSSEDMMHAYAIKMWGKVSRNADMEARVQPKEFIGNKVAGILFENKVDHTTYFDPNIEAIQGIHMIPILPSTPFVRAKDFVQEEWDAFFSDGRIDDIGNAWKGIIWASYASVEPRKAWEFFSSRSFSPQWLDGGASLTWFMAYSADSDSSGGHMMSEEDAYFDSATWRSLVGLDLTLARLNVEAIV